MAAVRPPSLHFPQQLSACTWGPKLALANSLGFLTVPIPDRTTQPPPLPCAANLFFTWPKKVKAGAQGRLFFNRSLSATLAHQDQLRLVAGFNNWQEGKTDLEMTPSKLPGHDGGQWCATGGWAYATAPSMSGTQLRWCGRSRVEVLGFE